jgi:tRNA(Ile)-lysidine synthase
MAAVREIEGLRLLRPLLGVPKRRLIATLRAAGQDWIDDPSNRAPGFARARLRQGIVAHAAPPAGCGTARAALDRRAAAWLARHARIDPAGFVVWRHEAFLDAPPEIARRALQQALATVGGRDYPPRSERLERLLAALAQPTAAGRTLAGCRVLRWREDLLICREPAAIAPALPLAAGVWQRWDRRFLVRWQGGAGQPVVRALGGFRGHPGVASLRDLPAAVRMGLASVWLNERLAAVAGQGAEAASLRFCPLRPLAGAPFAVTADEGRLRPVPYQRIARDDTFASI